MGVGSRRRELVKHHVAREREEGFYGWEGGKDSLCCGGNQHTGTAHGHIPAYLQAWLLVVRTGRAV